VVLLVHIQKNQKCLFQAVRPILNTSGINEYSLSYSAEYSTPKLLVSGSPTCGHWRLANKDILYGFFYVVVCVMAGDKDIEYQECR